MSASTPARRGLRLPAGLGPTMLLLVSLIALLAVIWGLLRPVEIDVIYVDAGPVMGFEIGRVDPYPEGNFYVVGLEDGRLRALDGRSPLSDCSVRWSPTDRRGVDHNPGGVPGVFEDPCAGALWSMVGNAIGGDEPMRTPHMDHRRLTEGGDIHLFVEIINPDRGE